VFFANGTIPRCVDAAMLIGARIARDRRSAGRTRDALDELVPRPNRDWAAILFTPARSGAILAGYTAPRWQIEWTARLRALDPVSMTQQRLRIRYRKTAPAADLQTGRLSRVWAEAFECAGLPLARPEGSKRTRIEVGPPLPQHATGEAELLDVLLAHPASPAEVVTKLEGTLPEGLEPLHAEEIGERLPSLQASLRSARYRIVFDASLVDAAELRTRIEALLALDELPWEELRGERLRQFDLRTLIHELSVTEESGTVVLHARLELSQERAGRPASLLAALEIDAEPLEIVREDIEVEQPRIALRAWRARGRFE